MAIDIATARSEVAKIYIAAFNRVPDSAGLAFWVSAYMNGSTLASIADGFASSQEYANTYPSYLTNTEYVSNIYTNVFGRAADTAGLAFWSDAITNGVVTKAALLNSMVTAAGGTGNNDGLRLANQATFAVNSVIAGTDSTAATAQLANITSDAATITTATTAATAAAVVGTTYTLTTSADTITGTASNDTITGVSAAGASAATDTLAITDTINGGAGTDTLSVINTANGAAIASAAISNVEIINIKQATAGQTSTHDASTTAGVTAVNSNLSTGVVTVTNLASGASAGVIGNATVTNGAFNAGWTAAATAATLNLQSGVTAGAVVITGAAVVTTVVNSTGAANTIGALTGAASNTTSTTINATTALTTGAVTNMGATLTITGAGAVNLSATALEAGVTTLNASANTGGLTVALGTLVTQAVTGSAGNDVITSGAILTTGSVNAGAGTDTLVLGTNVGHANTTTLGAKYTNFETLSVNGTFDASVISGLTAVTLSGATNSITGMTATQAAHVTASVDIDATTLALATATGTTDALTITLGTGLTTTEATDSGAGGLTVTGFETLNLVATPGATSTVGAVRVSTIAALTGATLNTVNMTGTAFSLTNAATTVACTFDASALTGDGTVAGANGLTIAGSLIAGSTVTGSAYIDAVTVGAEGSAYNLGAGADTVSATVALLVADGTTDGTINGGTGTDVITLTDTTTTLTDNHFTKLSNMETLTLSNTVGDASITTGAAFNAAFASGATITTGVMAATKDVTLNAGLSTVAVNLTIDATSLVGTAVENHVITTGTGADTVTFTGDATYVGVAGAGGSIAISTGAGADTISVTIGTMLAQTTTNVITITGGTGIDTITKVGVNSTTVQSVAQFVMAAGDSTTTAFDKITGFDVADGANLSDVLDFGGVGAVGTLATSTDSGTILSHSITTGVALFDDAAVYATALVINATNLADVVAYLAANTATLDTVAFAYDSDASGTADCTLVYNNGTTDSLVQLTGTTGVASLNATLTTATANCVAIA